MGDGVAGIPKNAVRPSWDDIEQLSMELADKVAAAGYEADRLVVLPRGGLGPANIVSRRLDITSDRILSAAITSFTSSALERADEFEFAVGQFPTDKEVKGLRLLVVDDVCDTGYTLAETVRRLQELGPVELRVAVLHYKPERSKTGYVPDYYVAETNEWIIYPWEWHEEPLRSSRETVKTEPALAP